ncbi:903_t:CDS:2 [Diversispora eburnea]|uniref:903_t:CDS:1 n=1 Tax=Diversispora eburnea TaxID=1213867 RepID=A0A9N8VYL6_9GLOM|nr:903_t:CDS:2 [Diversispora eburnea]
MDPFMSVISEDYAKIKEYADIKNSSNENELKSVSKHINTQHEIRNITEMSQTIEVNPSSEELTIESFFLTNKDLEKFLKDQAGINFNDTFNCIQFNKPKITINNESNIWSGSFDSNISNFLSIESNIYFGTSATSHAKVGKLIKLLINKKNKIDEMLESQPAYIIGPDFQKNSSVPNISCWTNEPLDALILEKLEELFDDEYEIVGHMIPIGTESLTADEKFSDFFQEFNISAYFQAKVEVDSLKRNILKFSIDVNDCGMGPMLSENWPLLRKLGSGYFLNSIEIKVAPIKDESMPDSSLYKIKDGPWPQQLNREIYMSEIRANNYGIDAAISRDPGVKVSHSRKNEQGFNFLIKEWERIVTNGCRAGLCWEYQYTTNGLQNNLNHRKSFAPGKHSCHWFTLKAMSGFRITITQTLRCEITDCWWRKLNPNTGSKLMKLCPKMAHTLEITFNSLESFNEKFANLKNSVEFHEDQLNINIT